MNAGFDGYYIYRRRGFPIPDSPPEVKSERTCIDGCITQEPPCSEAVIAAVETLWKLRTLLSAAFDITGLTALSQQPGVFQHHRAGCWHRGFDTGVDATKSGSRRNVVAFYNAGGRSGRRHGQYCRVQCSRWRWARLARFGHRRRHPIPPSALPMAQSWWTSR